MTTTIPTIPHIALDDTLGAVFIGHFVTTVYVALLSVRVASAYSETQALWNNNSPGLHVLPRPVQGSCYPQSLGQFPRNLV